jgi:AcrR family transcriptional regulator
MAATRQAIEITRRKPRQARAEETVSAILEAAAQILEKGGLPAFNTNAVAERAGVSIGTLYQYFADKNAILKTLAQREIQATLAEVGHAFHGDFDPTTEGRVRGIVRAMVNAFHGRQRARKAVLQAVLIQGGASELLSPVAAFIAAAGAQVGQGEQHVFAHLNGEQIFVLSRALMGTVRAAVLEERAFLRTPAFEDELVRLVLAYLGAVTQAARATRAATAPG